MLSFEPTVLRRDDRVDHACEIGLPSSDVARHELLTHQAGEPIDSDRVNPDGGALDFFA